MLDRWSVFTRESTQSFDDHAHQFKMDADECSPAASAVAPGAMMKAAGHHQLLGQLRVNLPPPDGRASSPKADNQDACGDLFSNNAEVVGESVPISPLPPQKARAAPTTAAGLLLQQSHHHGSAVATGLQPVASTITNQLSSMLRVLLSEDSQTQDSIDLYQPNKDRKVQEESLR
jgi:hypothetical protein